MAELDVARLEDFPPGSVKIINAGALAIGGWEMGTVAVNGDGKLPMDFGQELFAQNLDRLEIIASPAAERIPVLNEIGIRTVINGPIPVSAGAPRPRPRCPAVPR